jgi:glycosyltransferase involved in cell wall biosynthesis
LNILIVTQYFWPESFRVNDLALGLVEKGHRVTVLTGIPNYPVGKFFSGYRLFNRSVEDYKGVKVYRVPLIPRGQGSSLQLALNYLSFAVFASFLAPFYCREKYTLVFVSQYSPVTMCIPAIIIKKLQNIPLVLWVQDLWPESLSATGAVRSNAILGMITKLVRYIYRNCDQILVQSKAFLPRIIEDGVDRRLIRYFPNWAEELYKPVEREDDAHEKVKMPNGFRIMFAGNIGAAQDFGTILSAAERLRSYRDIHWVILGDGRMRSWVEEQIQNRRLEDTVHLLGRYPVEEMPHYFSLADAMLVTLKSEPIFSLTIPSKVQSYLACGRPIIGALDGEGARIITEAGAGLTCPAEDATALADAVLELYNMSESEREVMRLRSKAYYESHFKREILLSRIELLMEELNGNQKNKINAC